MTQLKARKSLALLLVLALVLAVMLFSVACEEEETTTTAAPTTTEAMTEDDGDDMDDGADAEAMDIVDTAVAAGQFTTLASLLTAADLVETLKGDGPFTVFAPTDDAFADVPQATLDALGADPTGALTEVLTYHVVSGQVMAADVTDGMEATTVNGATVTFTVSDDGVMINDANIVATDIVCTNGVIHVIDAVILPPEA